LGGAANLLISSSKSVACLINVFDSPLYNTRSDISRHFVTKDDDDDDEMTLMTMMVTQPGHPSMGRQNEH